jgi:hypothetical protein
MTDEWGSCPSNRRQWQERPRVPTIKREMPLEEIEYFRKSLVNSYGCKDSDITYEFKKINEKYDIKDEDMDNYLRLKYKHACIVHNVPQNKTIFTFKIPIPERLKKQVSTKVKTIGC